MNILIVEDEPIASRHLEKILNEIDSNYNVLAITDSVKTSVKWLESNIEPDLIIMDIDLNDGQSFEIFSLIEVHSPVIFTTAFDEYAVKAFKVNSIDYLIKPVKKDELEASLEKFQKNIRSRVSSINEILKKINLVEKPKYKSRFLLKVGAKMMPISVDEIAYFRSEEKLSYIYSFKGGRFLVDNTLDELEKILDPKKFFRANRQYLISIDSLENIYNYFNGKLKIDIKPKPTDNVLVSREKATEFKDWIDQ